MLENKINEWIRNKVGRYSPGLADFLTMPLRPRHGLIGLVMMSVGYFGCGGSGGGGGPDPVPVPPVDIVAPGQMNNLESYASVNAGEEVRLRWVSSGDDDWTGTPDHFIIRYSLAPITDETMWDLATDLATVTASGPAGTQYDMNLPSPAGDLYFAIKAVDEVGNEGDVSNSPNVVIPDNATFYVDKWLPQGNIYLDYPEAVAMTQGEGGVNPSYASALAAEMIQSTPAFPGTVIDLENFLLGLTDGTYAPPDGELYSGFDPFYLDNDLIGDPGVRLYGEPLGNPVDFAQLPPQAIQNIHNIIRDFLIAHVGAHPEDYANLDPSNDPTWNSG